MLARGLRGEGEAGYFGVVFEQRCISLFGVAKVCLLFESSYLTLECFLSSSLFSSSDFAKKMFVTTTTHTFPGLLLQQSLMSTEVGAHVSEKGSAFAL